MTRPLLALLLLLAASAPLRAAPAPLPIVATFTVLADMAHEVGGDRVAVRSLVGPNGDPHAFEPSPDDAAALRSARLVIVNGLGLEGWMDRLVKASGTTAPIVVASAGVPPLSLTEDGRPMPDPHAWNSPVDAQIYVRNIEAALAQADPPGAETYHANAARLLAALQTLDEDAHRQIDAIPPARRKVVTSHDGLGYFAHEFGVTILAPLGLSTETEASARHIAALIGQIRDEHIRTYFLENAADPRLVKQIAAATGAQPGGTLYVEALSAPGGPAPTFLAMLRHNLRLLVAAMSPG